MLEFKYPYTDTSVLNLDWFLEQFKLLVEEWKSTEEKWAEMQQNFQTLESTVQTFTTFVENYFENLDVQQEINNKLNAMALDGTLSDLLAPLVDDKLPDVVDTKLPGVVADQLSNEVAQQLPAEVAAQIDDAVAPGIPGAVTDWLDDNVNPVGSAVTIDSSLTIAGSAADAKVVGDILRNISYDGRTMKIIRPANTWHEGIWINNAESPSTSYYYSDKIAATPGDIIYVNNITRGAVTMRFVEFYDNNNTIVHQSLTSVDYYTVPLGAVSFIVTTYSQEISLKYLQIKQFTSLDKTRLVHNDLSIRNIDTILVGNQKYVLAQNIDNKKNCLYSFFGKFSQFGELEISHGDSGDYGAIKMRIDETYITIYDYQNNQMQQFTHGLTMTDFIFVTIKVQDTSFARAEVNVVTNGGSYKASSVIFFGSNGIIYAKPLYNMTDVEFVYTIMDLEKPVYIFGDSYIALADGNKWPSFAINDNDNNMLLCGFGGAKSKNEILSFRNIMQMGNPGYCCWLLGMNDADSGAINAEWLDYVQEVVTYCEDNDIVPILATIPNTPTVDNTYKNAWVKASGYKYIDFAKAVGAETAGSSWYTGMLSNDNIHPTSEGAKALWMQIITDCPEIINIY